MKKATTAGTVDRVRLFQTGWNYAQDGPGNRLILHFQGCNFDCPWCSNPEGRSPRGELFARPELLTPEICPRGAVSDSGLDRESCASCRKKDCLTVNRNQGLRFTAREYRVEELVQTALESRSMFFDGGGVTVTGGEATLQFAGLKTLLEKLRKEGIHTALETNGSHRNLAELLPSLDLLIFDLKHWDFQSAEAVLGNPASHVLSNLQKACAAGGDVLVRVTVIPGFNDSEADMQRFGALFSTLPRTEGIQFEILYFHNYGRAKWDAIGQSYKGPENLLRDDEKARCAAQLASFGLNLIST